MRDLTNVSHGQAEKNGWNIVKPLNCEVVGKAVYDKEGTRIMKSTKRFQVPGGWMYNTTTEIDKGGNITCAEALAFVPDANAGAGDEKSDPT